MGVVVKNRLKSIRYRYEMKQKEFAEYLELNLSQYNRYEKQNAQPALEIVLKIARKLGLSTDEIVYLDETEEPSE